MKRRLVLIFLLILNIRCLAQSPEIQTIEASLPRISDSLKYTDALNRLAMLLYEKNVDSTFYYTKKAREIAERLNYDKGKADALNNLGLIFDIKGNLQLSLRYYNDARNTYILLHDTANEAQTYMNIGLDYLEIGKNDRAIRSFSSAMAISAKLSNDSIRALVIYNYLLEYPQQFNKDSIDFYIAKAKSIAEKYKDNRTIMAILQLIADADIRHGERDKGLVLLDQAISQALAMHMYYVSMDMLIDMGDQLAATDTPRALGYYNKALAYARQNDYLYYQEAVTRKLYGFYADRHNNALAFEYCRQLLKLHDEQEQINNATSVDYIDYALKEQQLQSVKLNSHYESVSLVFTIVLCVMAIVISIIIWRNWRNTQKTTAILKLQFERSEETTAALDTMNKEYARLIKIVAHDLRNPVGAVSSIATMMVDRADLDDEAHEMARLMQTSADSSLKLISELLQTDFDHQQNLKKTAFLTDDLLNQSINLLNFRAKDKKLQLVLETESALKVLADREKVWRVINNLVVNAIKFSPEGSDIYVSGALKDGYVTIAIKDNGIGIPAAMQNQIFDPFTPARRKGTGGEQAFGLGLYISKQIIEAHGGSISFISAPGSGTTFYVKLPASVETTSTTG
jgi:signal transduction histidine kinase